MKEFKLIKTIKKTLRQNKNFIGDDCALVNKKWLYTTDTMVENVHFLKNISPKILGHKLVSINLSDIAACGGKPKYALLSLNLRKDLKSIWVKNFYKGVRTACKKHKLLIIGGNLSQAKEISAGLCVVGKTKKFVSRSNARPNELVFLTGKTGLSSAGFLCLKKHKKHKKLTGKHLYPVPRLDCIKFLQKFATSAIDISDGLSQDLGAICKKSGIGINIKNLHIDKTLKKHFPNQAKNLVLGGGEDYEIAFTIKPKHKKKALKKGFLLIGKTTKKRGQIFLNGRKIKPVGFEHFKLNNN